MSPPEAPDKGTGNTPPAVSFRLDILNKRADFLACARAHRAPVQGMLLQGRDRQDGADNIRAGFTASKKTGNAVTRNRAKRRLRSLARELLPVHGKPGWDYVLVARPGATVAREYHQLRDDLTKALHRIHGKDAS